MINYTYNLSYAGEFLHELSNDGAKHQFEKYVAEDILPVMVHCARVSVFDDLYQIRRPCTELVLLPAYCCGYICM